MDKAIGQNSPVELARAGSVQALGDLYELHGDDVYRLAFRITASPADAMDVLQDVFLALPDAIQKFNGTGSFERWLGRLAVRTALMKLRRRKRRREVRLGTGTLAAGFKRAEPVVLKLELERAIERLPEKLRTVFVLKEMEGYSHLEIAEMLEISARNSEVRLHRARMRIRAALTGGA